MKIKFTREIAHEIIMGRKHPPFGVTYYPDRMTRGPFGREVWQPTEFRDSAGREIEPGDLVEVPDQPL